MAKRYDAGTWLDKGYEHMSNGKHKDALSAFEKAIKADPKCIEDLLKYGQHLFVNAEISGSKNDYQAALDFFDLVIKVDSINRGALFNKANALCGLNRYEDAIATYDQLIKLDPQNLINVTERGNLLHSLERYEEAITAYDEALKLDPKLAYAWCEKGEILFQLERYEEALVAYDEALKLDPKFTNAWNGKGWSLYQLERNEEAIAAFDEAIKLDPEDEYAWHSKGRTFSSLERYDDAIVAFDKVIKLDPKNEYAWCDKGDALFEAEKYKEAIDCCEQGLKVNPNDKSIKETLKEIWDRIPKPDLEITFDETELVLNEWDKVSINIENTGNAKAENIQLSFSKDFETRGLKQFDLDRWADKSFDFAIKPTAKGKNLLEITTTYTSEGNPEYTKTDEFWIDVVKQKKSEDY